MSISFQQCGSIARLMQRSRPMAALLCACLWMDLCQSGRPCLPNPLRFPPLSIRMYPIPYSSPIIP